MTEQQNVSNIQIKSNIYIRANDTLQKDKEYVKQVIGYKLLNEISSTLTVFSGARLSAEQHRLIKGNLECTYSEHGEKAYGVVWNDGELISSCRCEKTDCVHYSSCMATRYAKCIERDAYTPDEDLLQEIELRKIEMEYKYLGVSVKNGAAIFKGAAAKKQDVYAQYETEPVVNQTEPEPVASAVSGYKCIEVPDEIITADFSARTILNSGPGTGKTYTIIQRLFYLLKNRLCNPQDIVVLCYTRAARNIVTDRIQQGVYSGELPAEAHNVCVLTFDAYASYFLLDMKDEIKTDINKLSYDQRIELFTQTITAEHIADIQYLIVDEMQDLVNQRAEMVLKLISLVNCGYLLCGDKCQAIYDFETDENRKLDSVEFYKRLEKIAPADAGRYEITKNNRQTKALAECSDKMRQVLLASSVQVQNEYASKVFEELGGDISKVDAWIKNKASDISCDTAVLCRSNGEAEMLSGMLCRNRIPHRLLRGSQQSSRLHRWIADVFWDYCREQIGKTDFINRYCHRVKDDSEKAEYIWGKLAEACDKKNEYSLRMSEVVNVLQKADALPKDFLVDDDALLTISTIHKAKGSEFDEVYLMDSQMDVTVPNAEEARTRYVALTRPKSEMHLLKKSGFSWCFKKRGLDRPIQLGKPKYKQYRYCNAIALGYDGDCDSNGFVLGRFDNALEQQQYIADNVKPYDELSISNVGDTYAIKHNNIIVGTLSAEMKDIFWRCVEATDVRRNIPDSFERVYVSEVITVISDHYSEYVPQEFRNSHIWLGLAITGMAKTKYNKD